MRYTIITPTLLRPTLKRLCDSINNQTYEGWQHVVIVDTLERDEQLLASIKHPQRWVIFCEKAHNDWAATCRRNAWDHAKGDYVLYIDDDNYLADPKVLLALCFATKPVVLFPLLYRGEYGAPLPIQVGRSDGNQLMVKREIGQWPGPGWARPAGDGYFIQTLTHEHEYEVFEDRPLVVYPQESGLSHL